jgi:hypothetical protein
MIVAIQLSEPTFLSLSEWLITPFRVHQPSPMQQLLSCVACLPSLLYKARRLEGSKMADWTQKARQARPKRSGTRSFCSSLLLSHGCNLSKQNLMDHYTGPGMTHVVGQSASILNLAMTHSLPYGFRTYG